ncbi:MAG: NTP transferase domain-containing protein [Victivallales bacterium]|nr:NTP transferase domain-containing protein [Victivallales bacterium]
MAKATLLVLAAGLGSRYGGIKQMDPIGANGEFVLDYSMFDALRAGFDKVVLVIRDELEEPLKEHFRALEGKVEIAYVKQRLTDLPTGFSCPEGRVKPWGTGHAIWSARNAVDSPFAAINADDFYGSGTFKVLADFLLGKECSPDTYAMVAFKLSNTLSENGTVSRGICTDDGHGFLAGVVERTKIEGYGDGARFMDDDGKWQPLTGSEPASMNFWGFSPSLFGRLEGLFVEFLKERGGELKSEFYIPSVVDTLIKRGVARARMLQTNERWFGMTYAEDRAQVVAKVKELTESGLYPAKLWN